MSEAGGSPHPRGWTRLEPQQITALRTMPPAHRAADTGSGSGSGPGTGMRGELAAMLAQAHAAGAREGEHRGRELGRSEGLALGRSEGRESGWQEGHALGWTEGEAQGRLAERAQALDHASAHLQAQAAHFGALATSLTQAWTHSQEAIAQELVELAQALAQQVMGEALRADPARVLALVRDLLQDEPALCGNPLLSLHPDDLALVEHHLADDLRAAGWRLRADARLERGGCVVRAASGELDAQRATRWQRVAEALACTPHSVSTALSD